MQAVSDRIATGALALAHKLGLRGLACMDVVASAEDGEMILLDVDTSPELHAASPAYQAALEAGLYPHQLLRRMVELSQQVSACSTGL